jgi:methylase of polypeptide subunit release factors
MAQTITRRTTLGLIAGLPLIASRGVSAAPTRAALIERLIGEVRAVLAPGGVLALELGSEHAAWALARLTEAGLLDAESEPDLAGVERLVFARQTRS